MPTDDLLERLISLRKEARLSQAALAQKLGVTPAAIAFYETRRRRVPTAMAARWVEACGAALHLVIVKGGEIPEGSLSAFERHLVAASRALQDADRALVLDVARGLHGGNPVVREMIAVQVPILLASARSQEGDEDDEAKANSS